MRKKIFYSISILGLTIFLSHTVCAQTKNISDTNKIKSIVSQTPSRPLESDEVFVVMQSSDTTVASKSFITKVSLNSTESPQAKSENPSVINKRVDDVAKQNADLRKELDEIKALLKKEK